MKKQSLTELMLCQALRLSKKYFWQALKRDPLRWIRV